MICPSCQSFITDVDAVFCSRCGQPLTRGGVSETLPQPLASEQFSAVYAPLPPPDTSGAPNVGAPLPSPLPKRARKKSSKKKSLLTVLGFILGVVVVCAALTTFGIVGGAILKHNAPNTPTPFVGTTAGQAVLFQDPLTSNANNWLDDSKNCFFVNGSYHIQGNFLCFAPVGIISDADISVQVQQVSGPPTYFYGIAFRHATPKTYYFFGIDSNSKWVFGKSVSGTVTRLTSIQENTAIKGGLNTTNMLMVRAKGSHFDFFVNGTKVGEADDTTFSEGKAGLISNTGIEVAFNNFEITTP